jgi:polysaccharide biosynthesis transport protein
MSEAMHMRTTIGIFRRHLLAFLLTAGLVPLCAWIAILHTPRRYTATGSLIYDPSQYKTPELQSILRSDPITDAVMESQAQVLRGLRVARRVAERGELYENPAFNAALRRPTVSERVVHWLRFLGNVARTREPRGEIYGPTRDEARDATVLAVQAALHVEPVAGSHVLEVTFTASDPLVAAAAVNNAMDIYIKDQFRAKAAAVHRATDWLRARAGVLRAQVREAEDRIAAYRAAHDFAQGMHAALDAEKISHLGEDLIHARADLAAADARLDAARGRAGAAAQAAIAPSVAALRANLDQLSAQYQALTARVGPNHPDAISGRRQVAEARRAVDDEITRVVAAAEQDRRAAVERVAALEQTSRTAQQAADAQARAGIPLNAMERDAQAARGELNALLERIQQTTSQHAIESADAHEISLALPPATPSWPRPLPAMAAAIAAGVVLGLLLVNLLHLADTTLHGGEDVRTLLDLPCFALVPELSRRALRQVSIQDFAARRPLTAFSEQIRAVRAGLYLGAERPRVVAITAARPAEGKSMLALSLARSSGLGGEKVLLIDCDMRRPSLARWLQADNAVGLAELLRGEAEVADVLHEDPISGMHFIPAGRPGGDTFGMFMGAAMARLLADARRQYSLILLDSPPVQAITEARVLAAIADAAVLCIRWCATPRAVVSYSRELLEDAHAQVVGAVLTRVDPKAHVRSGYADAEVYHPRYKAYHTG